MILAKSRKPKSLNSVPSVSKARYVVETITTLTTTTVMERRIVREAGEDVTGGTRALTTNGNDVHPASGNAANANQSANQQGQHSAPKSLEEADYAPPIPPKEVVVPSTASQISGILKGGKLWKQDSISQVCSDVPSLSCVHFNMP